MCVILFLINVDWVDWDKEWARVKVFRLGLGCYYYGMGLCVYKNGLGHVNRFQI